MAHAAGDAHEYPVYGYHYRATFPIRDVNGDLVTGAAGLDSEISIDQGTAADCTNEATEIATSSGMYYLDLTGAELTSKNSIVKVKSTTTDSKDVILSLYPVRLPVLETGTAQAGANDSITLASGASSEDNFYNGLFVGITNDTPTGVDNQLRRIISYNGTTKEAILDSNWGTNPTGSTTYEILIPEGYSIAAWGGIKIGTATNRGLSNLDALITSRLAPTVAGRNLGVGTTGNILVVDALSINAIGSSAFQNNAITAAKITDGSFTAAKFASNAFTDAKFAADAKFALASEWTATRAGYVDNINLGGLAASQADIAAITQAQRVRVVPAPQMERPDSGSTTYRIWIYSYNEQHQAEDLDSNPTVTAENNAGADRSTNLGTVTKPGATTGQYYVDYTVADTHAIEGLVFKVDATENAVTTQYPASSIVSDTTAVDFTTADRAKLDTLHDTRIPGVIQPQTGDAFARLGAPAGASVSADIAAVKAESAQIILDTNELQTDLADGGRLDVIFDAILLDTGTTIPGQISGLNDLSEAQVNAQVADVLSVDTLTLPGQAAPPATPTTTEAIAWLFKRLRNKKDQDANTWQLYADDGTTVDTKAALSDVGGTLTFDELQAGP